MAAATAALMQTLSASLCASPWLCFDRGVLVALKIFERESHEDYLCSRRFFTPHFKFGKVWETIYPTRRNLYFAASQKPIEVFA
jgi:hypothetical protein